MDVNVFDSTSIVVEDIDIKNDIMQEKLVAKEDIKITEISSERTGKYIKKLKKDCGILYKTIKHVIKREAAI